MQVTTRLEQFIHSHLPLVQAMQASIKSYDGKSFCLQAPLSANHNDKYTAFGGSLYNLCITNAIGLGFLKAYEQGLDPNWVVAEANVKYLAPASDEILTAHCQSPSAEQWQEFFQKFKERGRAKINLSSTVYQGDAIACEFQGLFALLDAKPL